MNRKSQLVFTIAMALMLAVTGMLVWARPSQAASVYQAKPTKPGAAASGHDEIAKGSVIVKFKASAEPSLASVELSKIGATAQETLAMGGAQVVSVASGTELSAVAALQTLPDVEYAEPNYILHTSAIPNDPYYASYQWNMPLVHAPEAWDRPQGAGPVVGVIDTGLDQTHTEFAGRVAAGAGRTADSDGNCGKTVAPDDDQGHGTHVSGIIGAKGNNGVGIAGIAWNSIIMPFKAANSDGRLCTSDWIYGLNWLADHGAKVVNMSFGGCTFSQAGQDAVTAAWNRGLLLVAAAGNSADETSSCGNVNPVEYPASYNNVISVGAVGSNSQHSYFSEFNQYVDLAAPGGDATSSSDPPTAFIESTFWRGASSSGYAGEAGTSQATPHVVGAAALLLSDFPSLTNAQLRDILLSTTTDLGAAGRDDYYGTGLLNVFAALNKAASLFAPPTNTPVPATPTIGAGCLFSDVCPADFFFTPVKYLVNKGAISGYSDQTFRPGANATRAQLSKILVISKGWATNTTGGQHFTDVPTSNPFYNFVETAFHHGVISGYSDGTFRPGANVTRSQLSKIIVVAQGWATNTTGGQHFNDVPTSNPFYNFVETAFHHNVISGYSDGTFRPGANATRGQISKIVYVALTQ